MRFARADDAHALSRLVLYSAPHTLPYMLGVSASKSLAFLSQALAMPCGQFGYQNHRVVVRAKAVVGSGCAWHAQLPDDFDKKTLESLISFFGKEHALGIVARSHHLSACLPGPQSHSLGLGHIAVARDQRRSGIGSILMDYFLDVAKRLEMSSVTLNVDIENNAARAFYRAIGFTEKQILSPPADTLTDVTGFIHCYKAV